MIFTLYTQHLKKNFTQMINEEEEEMMKVSDVVLDHLNKASFIDTCSRRWKH